MQAMRVAKAFGRQDVDAFLDDITHEQYVEWCVFFSIEPQGWDAIRIAAVRICFWIVQTCSRRPLKESDFDIVIGGNIVSPEVEKARMEAFSIRQNLALENDGQED